MEDGETGLYYNWHRYYDPATGRYLSADPIGLEGGMNLYLYTGANPVNAVDPEGLDYWIEGADDSEAGYGFHQSVCVGKWNGSRKCISFGRMKGEGDCLFNCEGHVYYDRSKAGEMVSGKYRYTSTATDAKISSYFDKLVGEKSRWDVLFGKNCRKYSQHLFEQLVETYGGFEGGLPKH